MLLTRRLLFQVEQPLVLLNDKFVRLLRNGELVDLVLVEVKRGANRRVDGEVAGNFFYEWKDALKTLVFVVQSFLFNALLATVCVSATTF